MQMKRGCNILFRDPQINDAAHDVCHTKRKIIDKKVLEKVDNIKILGLSLDCDLSWDNFIVTITQQASKYIRILSKIKGFFFSFKSLGTKNSCYNLSNLLYGNSIWGSRKEVAFKPYVLLEKKDYTCHGGNTLNFSSIVVVRLVLDVDFETNLLVPPLKNVSYLIFCNFLYVGRAMILKLFGSQ